MGQNPAEGGSPQDGEPGWQSPSQQPSPEPDQPSQPAGPPAAYQPPPGAGPTQSYGPPPGYGPPPSYGAPQGYAPPPGYGYPPAPQYLPPGAGMPLADKPGVIPLRPLAVGELLDGAFATIRLNPRAMLGLAFVIVLVGQLVSLALNLAANDASNVTRFAVWVVALVITQLMTTITSGVAVIVIGEAVLGDRITPGDTLARLRGRIWRLIALGLLVSLITVVGFLLFVIPGIYLAVALSLVTPAFILEKTTVRAALRRSNQLVRDAWWRTLGILLLAYLVGTIISGLIQLPFTIFAGGASGFLTPSGDVSTGSEILVTVGRVIGDTLTIPIIAGTIALMYVDRRMRREGLDLVLAQSARDRRGQS